MNLKRNLIRAYVNGNFGDDLFIHILCNRYGNQNFQIVGSRYYKSFFIDLDNLEYICFDDVFSRLKRIFFHCLGKISNCSALKYYDIYLEKVVKLSKNSNNILISGSYYIEWNDDKEYWKYIYNLDKKYYQKSPYVLGINFGPYKTNEYYSTYKSYLSNAKCLHVRDIKTFELLSDIGADYCPDVVFSLNQCTELISEEEISDKKKLLIISVISQKYSSPNYIKKIVEIIRFYKSQMEIALVSLCNSEGDMKVIKEIYNYDKQLAEGVKVYDYSNIGMKEMLRLFYKADFVIAGRYHSMIVSWLFNTKCIPICYSPKMINVINDLNSGSLFYSLEEINSVPNDILSYYRDGNIDIDKVINASNLNFEETDQLLKE